MNTDVRRDIGRRLKQARQAARFTQEDVAKRLGLKAQTVSSWERGKSMPKAGEWYELGPLLGVSLDYLVYGLRPESPLIRAILGAPGVEPPPAFSCTPARLPAS